MFRSSSRPIGLRSFAFTSEHVWGTLGCSIAIASGSFGIYMNLYGPSQPNVNGREYLTIFAQVGHRPGIDRTPSPPGTMQRLDPVEIDSLPTGSIGSRREAEPATASGAATGKSGFSKPPLLKDFRLRDVFGDTALVEDQERLRIVKVGTVLGSAGRVTAIEQRDGQWAVVTSEGVITRPATSDK